MVYVQLSLDRTFTNLRNRSPAASLWQLAQVLSSHEYCKHEYCLLHRRDEDHCSLLAGPHYATWETIFISLLR